MRSERVMLRILPAAILFNSYPWLSNDCQHVARVNRAREENRKFDLAELILDPYIDHGFLHLARTYANS
jgi:hypothetical protein